MVEQLVGENEVLRKGAKGDPLMSQLSPIPKEFKDAFTNEYFDIKQDLKNKLVQNRHFELEIHQLRSQIGDNEQLL